MSETIAQPISILVIEDDPGDFGLIRAHVRMSGLVQSGDKELSNSAQHFPLVSVLSFPLFPLSEGFFCDA